MNPLPINDDMTLFCHNCVSQIPVEQITVCTEHIFFESFCKPCSTYLYETWVFAEESYSSNLQMYSYVSAFVYIYLRKLYIKVYKLRDDIERLKIVIYKKDHNFSLIGLFAEFNEDEEFDKITVNNLMYHIIKSFFSNINKQ